MAGVILDAGAVAGLAQGFKVVAGAFFEPGGFKDAVFSAEFSQALGQLGLDVLYRGRHAFVGGDEVLGRVDVDTVALGQNLAGERIEFDDALDLVVPELNPDGEVFVGGMDGQGVAADAELAARQGEFVALVLLVDEAAQNQVSGIGLALFETENHALVILGLAETVDAGDGGDDQHVAALEQRAGGGVAQLVDLLVDVRLLGDVGVGAGDVRLRLVVVVVGNEVLDRVVGEEVAELGAELRGEGLVVGEDEGRPVELGDDVGHGERLARAGDAEQRLGAVAGVESLDQAVDRVGLIAGWPVVGAEFERSGVTDGSGDGGHERELSEIV